MIQKNELWVGLCAFYKAHMTEKKKKKKKEDETLKRPEMKGTNKVFFFSV